MHEDAALLVLDKDSGLLTVPGIGPEKADCLASRVDAAYPGARIVHRLDRDTSGLIIMARDARSHRYLSRQFEIRQVEKRYMALVAGAPNADEGTVDLPIAKDLLNAPRQKIDHEQGRPSVTNWRVVARLDNPSRTRIALSPITGRSHQLRLHMLEIGLPILGDDLYSPEAVRAMSPRLCLHADHIEFTHPITRETVSFDSPAPF